MLHYIDPAPENAPAVVLLHGLGANGESWLLQVPPLTEAGFRPLAPDMPGFGKSPYDGKGWSVTRCAAETAALLDDLGVDAAHVVGLSMGGVIAQRFALDFPHRVRKLVLVSTFAALRPKSAGEWLYFAWRFFLVHTLGLPAQAKAVAKRLFPRPEQEAFRQMLIEAVAQADPRAYRAAMRALWRHDARRALRALDIPTLVVTGEEDTTVPPESQRQLAGLIPGARQVVIPGAGHALSVDSPEAFNRELLAFLTE
ncbi:MAG: alpha/beta fold hydrolase [Anaerolineae bacterium]|nr:MAG: alpha/beta fold hydrolase [Anaerolineae bacterium]